MVKKGPNFVYVDIEWPQAKQFIHIPFWVDNWWLNGSVWYLKPVQQSRKQSVKAYCLKYIYCTFPVNTKHGISKSLDITKHFFMIMIHRGFPNFFPTNKIKSLETSKRSSSDKCWAASIETCSLGLVRLWSL